MAAAGAAFLSALPDRQLMALTRADAVYAAGFRAPDGSYGIATATERGEIVARIALPARAHGLATCQATGRCAAFARRPGTFAMIFDAVLAKPVTIIHTPPERHFYGHGKFSPDGHLLYASENHFAENRGVIGVYDARNDFARIGELDAYGIGTHDMSVSDDGTRLIIANGGIATHPDFGRTKLNLDEMQPSLVLVDAQSGALVQKHSLPPALSRLSTRHIDLADKGRIWFACQYEGSRNDHPPLTGYFAEGDDIQFIDLPEPVTEALGHYIGAIAVNRRENIVGLASPKGGTLLLLNSRTGAIIGQRKIQDAAGVAPATGTIAASSYGGLLAQTISPLAWDQHLVRL
ncbi:DUF1513 domain-containing protein [Aureimonas fodinaquatilis]|uniref:DUF1513 domain-containing protein n=2 Tax=Aureimonas fodinaquatilis TaxID=2565783 RepID=A0A5B0DSC6_9HYPH|nr:DUF1513 domain-containing protein [Aureimonas fodinaquatilis]